MALRSQSPSKHNRLFGGKNTTTKKIPHPASTGYYDDHELVSGYMANDAESKAPGTPSPKRRKIESRAFPITPSKSLPGTPQSTLSAHTTLSTQSFDASTSRQGVISVKNPELERPSDFDPNGENTQESNKTQLEAALPTVQTDAEAIEAYEAQQASDAATAGGNDDDTLETRMAKRSWTKGRSSIYLDAFNLALSTVLEEEAHLFDEAEHNMFKHWENLTYEAQYLYVRLFLRKTSSWFRIGKLGYYDDIADMENAVQELQSTRSLPGVEQPAVELPKELVALDATEPLSETFNFAECSNDQITTLDEASGLLLLDELKVLAKDAKVRGKNKTELLQNLRRSSGKQKGLAFFKRSETEESVASGRSTPTREVEDELEDVDVKSEPESVLDRAETPTNENRDAHYTKKILEQTGECIRLSLIPLKVFERVHLVFYRSTEWTEKSLTTLVLAKIARKCFPEYIVSRSATIFESRSLLLEFEACLRTQLRVDNILEFNGTATRKNLEEVKSIFEAVEPRWRILLANEQSKEDRVYETGEGAYLRRFSPAWVYTRIVHKALEILGRFKEHLREHALICTLLKQRLFHAARRGVWYQRKALLEEHYMFALTDDEGRSEEANKKHWKRISLHTCEEGLQDKECHIVYHYDLQKRIKKLEKQLRVPRREQHDFGHVGLLKPREIDVEGIQITRDDSTPNLRRKSSNPDLPSLSREQSLNAGTNTPIPARVVTPVSKQVPYARSNTPEPNNRRGTKTIWLDTLDTNELVSVESLTLSHYRKKLGYKGFHSEGGILRTLFGLLFYDIIFAYVPNVFQTAYQTCPLDLHTDAFYGTRISEINARINEISNGQAEFIIQKVWTEHEDKKTCIVGVRWDYVLEDLVEITRCWNGEALGTVMRVLAQEYGERGGGVPDLFLWQVFDATDSDADKICTTTLQPTPRQSRPYGKVLFCEVKSENDRLSDKQRLWNSVLLNAGIEVELCHVTAREVWTEGQYHEWRERNVNVLEVEETV